MKTKTKNVVALLATLAIGTASVAGLALGANANHGLIANADTSITAVAESYINLNVENTVTVKKGEEKTFVFNINEVGTYGFERVSGGPAIFKFEGIDKPPVDPDEPLPVDPDDPDNDYEVSEPFEDVPFGLDAERNYFYIQVETPDTAKVTIYPYEDMEEEETDITFKVTRRVDTGLNVFSANYTENLFFNQIPAGKYHLEWAKGNGNVKIGGETYTLKAEKDIANIELSDPENTAVEVTLNTDEAFEFNLIFDEQVSEIKLGKNTLTIAKDSTAYVVINDVTVEDEDNPEYAGAGYYTFTLAENGGSATFKVENKTFDLNAITPKFTIYFGTPRNTVISVSNGTKVSFELEFSATDPNAQKPNTLNVGTTKVNATGDGVEYTFTNESDRKLTYLLSCKDTNAFIMREVQYVGFDWTDWEWIELFEGEYNNYGELIGVTKYLSYEFTLEAGASITFLMTTYDWSNASYNVTIEIDI